MLRSLRRHSQIASLLGALTLLFLGACSQDSPSALDNIGGGDLNLPPATDYIQDVAGDGLSISYVEASMPAAGEAPAPQVLGAKEYVVGSGFVIMVTPDPASTELYVSVLNTDPGYWLVDLTAVPKRVDGSIVIFVTPTEDAPTRTIKVRLIEGNGSSYSAARHFLSTRNSTAAASEFLQVSLNWVHGVDLDLHVECPDAETIYFANPEATNGGVLDLDSNPGCNLDWVNNENITWPTTQPPVGDYTVRVHLWSACGDPGPFPYLVSWTVNGQYNYYIGEMPGSATVPVDITTLSYTAP